MQNSTDNRIQNRLFTGFCVDSKIQFQLKQCNAWQESVIAWQSNKSGLQEVQFQGKKYIGKYLEDGQNTLKEIAIIQSEIIAIIKEVCPDLKPESLKIMIFPLVFVN